MNIEEIKFGDEIQDKVTEFTGIVIAKAFYATGCNQVCLAPKSENGKFNDAVWFDEQRVVRIKKNAVSIPNTPTGGPGHASEAPPRR